VRHAALTAIPATLNLWLTLIIALAGLGLLLGVPALAALGGPAAFLLIPPCLLLTLAHWALIHEAIHGHLHPRRAVNDALGRLLAICFGTPFAAVRFGHLSHHALNARAAERPELYDPELVPAWRARLQFYPRLVIGVYGAELASAPLSLLPRRLLRPLVRRLFYEGAADAGDMASRAERVLLGKAVLRMIRLDAVAIILLFALAFWLYGAAWPVLALAIALRGIIVSVMDNAPHYGGALHDPAQGYDTRAPAPVRLLVLNSNFHGTHHRHPSLPWTALPGRFAGDRGRFVGAFLRLPWRQFRGPIPLRAAPSAGD
jgi:fatty acid desaturase